MHGQVKLEKTTGQFYKTQGANAQGHFKRQDPNVVVWFYSSFCLLWSPRRSYAGERLGVGFSYWFISEPVLGLSQTHAASSLGNADTA
eukprot:6293328-Amphidinium_carterae.1